MVILNEYSLNNDAYCVWGNVSVLQMLWQQRQFKGTKEQKNAFELSL